MGLQEKNYGNCYDGRSAVGDRPSAARGAGVNVELSQAAMRGDAPAMQRLIARGAKVNAKEKSGWTALMLASQSGVLGAVKVLIDNAPTSMRLTAAA